jgi:hypothetical protein
MQICRIFSDKAISSPAPAGNGPEQGGPEPLLDTVILQEYANLDIYAAGEYASLVTYSAGGYVNLVIYTAVSMQTLS